MSEGSVMACVCMAASRTESQMFTDGLNANGNSKMNSVVYRLPIAQIQSNALKLTVQCIIVQMKNDMLPKHPKIFFKAR